MQLLPAICFIILHELGNLTLHLAVGASHVMNSFTAGQTTAKDESSSSPCQLGRQSKMMLYMNNISPSCRGRNIKDGQEDGVDILVKLQYSE